MREEELIRERDELMLERDREPPLKCDRLAPRDPENDERADDPWCDEGPRAWAAPASGKHNASATNATMMLRKTRRPTQGEMGEMDMASILLILRSTVYRDNRLHQEPVRTLCRHPGNHPLKTIGCI